MTTLTLIGKPGCHLCDVAEQIVESVVADLPPAVADRVEIEQASIADDVALYEKWWEKIPVVLIDGELHAHWRVSADRLRAALLASESQGASA
ncbi:glutaredoxin family protein [Microbacterium trichothecenolyticum]|uniref:Thioredoxin/glutaredoxin n=1 Tax=Microbacterium trichothecenolyticum TaxID=69370 RepID=A0ABU0U048_MICTR|nr:glutaredoxin family protein [Microbacterium trichothecenolyticum]MDQ1124549.1 putative thioredoxin/glutaredoxin [Microbacterium trichothecenolyticum]